MLVHLWRIWLGKRLWVNGFDQGVAVVLIELWPNFGLIVKLRALCNAFPGLAVSFQAAHENSIKLQGFCAGMFAGRLLPILAQANTLSPAHVTELVVIVCAKRCLTVAH